MDEDFDFDEEFTPEQIADIKRSIQDANEGFTYEMIPGEHWEFKCNKCGRQANFHEKPFPHKFNCPMKRRYPDLH